MKTHNHLNRLKFLIKSSIYSWYIYIKNSQQNKIKGNLNLIKDSAENSVENIIMYNDEKQYVCPKIGNKLRITTLTTAIQHCVGVFGLGLHTPSSVFEKHSF